MRVRNIPSERFTLEIRQSVRSHPKERTLIDLKKKGSHYVQTD